jgi:hypothetical protein
MRMSVKASRLAAVIGRTCWTRGRTHEPSKLC